MTAQPPLRLVHDEPDTVEIPRAQPRPPTLRQIIRDLDPFAVGVAVGLLLSVVLIVGGSWLLTVAGWAQ